MIYLNDNGKELDEETFLELWRNRDSLYSRWDHMKRGNTDVATLSKNLYQSGHIDYEKVKKELESITSSVIDPSMILLLEYWFEDDLCTINDDNKWSKEEINSRKRFTSPIKHKIEEEYPVIYIYLFEKGVKLKNNSKKVEYYFSDQSGYFRENIFKFPTNCGSFALIKPNGEILIRNGEYRADEMVQHLKPENWPLFFKY